jgi:hypothetical protein
VTGAGPFRRVAPFGVRFWDAVAGAVAGDGLTVELYPAGRPDLRAAAAAGRSGVYSARGLPGLLGFEVGEEASPVPRPFTVEVADPAGRFQPFLLPADLPTPGLLAWDGGDLVPLFSTPARPVPAGTAAVRADLWDAAADAPAAWAVLEVTPPGRPAARGLADAKGRVAVLFAYPEPPDSPTSSPAASPLASPPSPRGRAWDVGLRALYGRRAGPPPERPDLRGALGQPPATLLEGAGSPAHPLTAATLRYGQELTLRSRGPADSLPALRELIRRSGGPADPLPVLLVTPP